MSWITRKQKIAEHQIRNPVNFPLKFSTSSLIILIKTRKMRKESIVEHQEGYWSIRSRGGLKKRIRYLIFFSFWISNNIYCYFFSGQWKNLRKSLLRRQESTPAPTVQKCSHIQASWKNISERTRERNLSAVLTAQWCSHFQAVLKDIWKPTIREVVQRLQTLKRSSFKKSPWISNKTTSILRPCPQTASKSFVYFFFFYL